MPDTPIYLYGGGTHTFTADQFETDYVVIGIHTATDATPQDLQYVTEELHPKCRIRDAAETDDTPGPDMNTLKAVRAELVKEYPKISSTTGAATTSPDRVQDWEYFTCVTAGAWGLAPDEHAMWVG